MFLRTAIGRIRIEELEEPEKTSNSESSNQQPQETKVKEQKSYEFGDVVKSVNVIVGEQDRASSCSIELDDPSLILTNEYLEKFQKKGGILVPKGLLTRPQAKKTPDTGTQSTDAGNSVSGFTGKGAKAYKEYLIQTYGSTDLSQLTARGKRYLKALDNYWVRGFLDAVADAELSPTAARSGNRGYGFLFGDKPGGKETFNPRNFEQIKDHPRRSRTLSGLTSTATGRYQTLDLVWDDDTPYGKRGIGLTSMHPLQQEILAVGRLAFRRILDDVEVGRYEQAFGSRQRRGFGAMWEWASLNRGGRGAYGRQRTPWGEFSRFVSSARQFASNAKEEVVKVAQNVQSSLESAAELTDEEKAQPTQERSVLDSTGTSNVVDKDIVEAGIKLHVDIGFNDSNDLRTFTYFVTGIRASKRTPQSMQIQGKQLRYLMAIAPKKFGTYRNYTLRLLIKLVAERNGLKYILPESDAKLDSVVSVIQNLENDIQFLNRLLTELGYAIASDVTSPITFIISKLKPDDKRIKITEDVILPNSEWGDIATDVRILQDAENLEKNEKELFDLTNSENSDAGIGKGFESTIGIDTLAFPEILAAKPGEIISIQPNTLGKALARDFRISGVRHSMSGGAIQTLLNVYLPVRIQRTVQATPSTSNASAGTNATAPQGEFDTSKWADKYKRPLSRGDNIAGFRVSSPFGPRPSPGGIGSRLHGGVDVAAGRGTPLYLIGKPDEEIEVIYFPGFGSGGNTVGFLYAGFYFEYMHMLAVMFPARQESRKMRGGSKVGEIDSTGSSTGHHLHFQMRKGRRISRNNPPTFNPPGGWVYWSLKGSPPPST